MKLNSYLKQLEQDSEYQIAKDELKPFINIANDVLELRLKHRWSQTELAERANTKQANISRLESALANPTISFLQKIADAFDTELEINLCPKNRIDYVKVIEVPIPIIVSEEAWSNKYKKTKWAPATIEV